MCTKHVSIFELTYIKIIYSLKYQRKKDIILEENFQRDEYDYEDFFIFLNY